MTEQGDQGLPLLDINCKQKFTGNSIMCRDKKKTKKKTVQKARVLVDVCLTLLFLKQEFKKSSHNLDLSRVKIKIQHSPNTSKAELECFSSQL